MEPRCRLSDSGYHVDGTDPAYGTWSYYFHDHLGSTRRLRDASKTSVAAYEYMPYGQVYAASGTTTATTHTYAMLAWDDTAGMYFAPFRYYMPQAGRWTTRDPLGMVDGPNVYAYVGGGPVVAADPTGLAASKEECARLLAELLDKQLKLMMRVAKYDPVADFFGGCPISEKKAPGGKKTQPGTHYRMIKNAAKKQYDRVKNYQKLCRCKNDDDDFPGPGEPIPLHVFRGLERASSVPHPYPPNGPFHFLTYLPGSDAAYYNMAWYSLIIGLGAGGGALGLAGAGAVGAGAGCASSGSGLKLLAPLALAGG